MNLLALIAYIVRGLVTDRVLHTGAGTSTGTLVCSKSLAMVEPPTWLGHAQIWLALAGTIVGVLVGIATLVYTILKIRALLANQRPPNS